MIQLKNYSECCLTSKIKNVSASFDETRISSDEIWIHVQHAFIEQLHTSKGEREMEREKRYRGNERGEGKMW
jgi:hypothetical protein